MLLPSHGEPALLGPRHLKFLTSGVSGRRREGPPGSSFMSGLEEGALRGWGGGSVHQEPPGTSRQQVHEVE